jgi:hypothetical protein
LKFYWENYEGAVFISRVL